MTIHPQKFIIHLSLSHHHHQFLVHTWGASGARFYSFRPVARASCIKQTPRNTFRMRIFDQLAIGVFTIYLTYYCRKHYSTSSSDIILLIRNRFLSSFPDASVTTTIASNPATTITTSTLFEAPTDQVIYVPEVMLSPRKIVKAFEAVEQAEGAGARVRRSLGTAKLRNFSPFLMLDHFTIGEGAGFPDHPHRYLFLYFPEPQGRLFSSRGPVCANMPRAVAKKR